jgi:hypothetical protein
MKGLANYLILPELKLILECCKGQASVEDAVNMKKNEMSDNLYNPGYNIIVDFQDFETSLNMTIHESISSFFNFLKEIEIKSKVAFLTTKPHQVVISESLKRLSSDSSTLKIETFSTSEAAIRFIGHPMDDFYLINNKILELNKNTA